MNPLSRRRAERRRLIADWAARAQRVPRSDAEETVDGDYGAGEADQAPVRRLPFELLEAPAAVALAEPARNGNGYQADEPVEPAGPPVATAATTQETEAPQATDAPEVAEPAVAGPSDGDEPPEAAEPAEPVAVVETPSLLQAARKALEGGELERARQLYRELLEQHPEDIAARNGLALVLDASGEHQAALEQLDRCRAQDESNMEVLVDRCGVLGTLGRYADAERGLRTALEREPGNAAAHFQLGLVASRRGRWRDAVPCFVKATALDPNLSGVHFYLGEALNHMDDLPGALQAYQRAVELSPHNPKAWYGMGIVLDRMNRPDDAAQLYRRSRELQGK